jgi:hypothetical protein
MQDDIDPEDIRLPDIVAPAPEPRAAKIDLPVKTRDYLHTDMAVLGEFANALTMTWARILQLDHMETKKQKDPRKRWFNLTMGWFETPRDIARCAAACSSAHREDRTNPDPAAAPTAQSVGAPDATSRKTSYAFLTP